MTISLRLGMAAVALWAGLGSGHVPIPAAAAQTPTLARAAPPSQCPPLQSFIARLGQSIPDLGGSPLVDEEEARVERTGSRECPASSATRCEKLVYFSFMLALLDMSPATYRRPGIAAFMANLEAEDAGLGDKCSAESLSYRGNAIRGNFPDSLRDYFCSPSGPGFALAQRANLILPGGQCDTTDPALQRLRDAIVAENPASLTRDPEYRSQTLGPVVIRIYRYRFSAPSDTEAFRYRGRGFIQITGREAYEACQRDVERAARHLQTNPDTQAATRAVTGLDWNALNVVTNPELVSQNRFVAAFCTASYWNRRVAPAELVPTRDMAAAHFARVVSRINASETKAKERQPQFTRWCEIAQCPRNHPDSLNMAAGFQALAGFRRTGSNRGS